MEDQELLAAVGQVVVDAARLEYFVAVLLAVTDGHRDQDCEDHAVAMVKVTGEAMRELRRRACARILAGEFRPGEDPLPSEKDLQEFFEVSRDTARRAVAVLRDEGLVITVPQRGTYVVPQSERPGG